jgi:hypothetical protein
MRIEVLRTGGFAAIRRHAAVDTSTHPDGPRLAALAESALTTPAPTHPAVPDGFSYTITIDTRTLHCTDPHLSPAQRELIQAVLGEGA